MKISPDCITRERAIQAAIYEAAGMPDHTFSLPRPFLPRHFEHLIEELGVNAEGLANQNNQVLTENISNNTSNRIVAAAKFNSALELAQANGEREDEEPKPLQTQDDLDELVAAYDFSGIRLTTGESVVLTPVQRELNRLVKMLIKTLLKASGLASQGKPAPVTVARKDTEPTDTQISFDEFLVMVEGVVEGEGIWGEEEMENENGELVPSPYYAKREQLNEQAKTNVAAVQLDADALSTQLQAG